MNTDQNHIQLYSILNILKVQILKVQICDKRLYIRTKPENQLLKIKIDIASETLHRILQRNDYLENLCNL